MKMLPVDTLDRHNEEVTLQSNVAGIFPNWMTMAKINLIKSIDPSRILGAGLVGAGMLLACASGSSSADALSSDVSWSVIGRNITITQPVFTAVGDGSFSTNTATVASGSSVTLAGNYTIQEADTSFCPFCVIQLYTAWIAPAPAGSAGFFSGIIFPGFGTQSGQILNQQLDATPVTMLAPKVPGTYFIGLGSTLDFIFQPNVGGGFGNDVNGTPGFAPFQVTVVPIALSPNPNPITNTLNTSPGFYYSTGGDYTNDGTLINDNANLTHTTGIFSNNGTLINQGDFNNSGTLDNRGNITNAGVLNNQGNLINQGVLNNSGAISNSGQFNLAATGQVNGAGSFINTNQGTVQISGAGPHVFDGNIDNEGTFKLTDTSVQYTGNFTNNGAYISDPSTSQFNDLTVGANGYLAGGVGDQFIVTGNFNNASTQNTLWNTTNADLIFSGPVSTHHTMGLAGVDKGIGAINAVNNFSWGSMTLSSGNALTLIDGNSTPGAALYASRIVLPGGVNQLNSISSDYNIYFDPTLPENQYLLGAIRRFGAGNGQLAPWSLVPFASDAITDSGLTPDQQNFAAALDEACASPSGILITRCLQLQGLSPSQQKLAIASLTPDQVPGQMAGPIKFNLTRMDAPFSRLASLRAGAGNTLLSFNFNGVQVPNSKRSVAMAPYAKGGAAGDEDNELFRDNPLGIFIQSRFNFGNMQNNAWDRGFESEGRAVTVGADYRISDQLVSGLAFSYTNASTEYVESAGRMNSDTFMGAFYGSYYLPKDFYVDWVANYGSNEYSFNRQYGFLGFNGLSNANPSGHQHSFAVSTGKDLNWQEWLIGPYLRLEYLNMHIGEYREHGGSGFDLTTSAQDNDSFISNLGVQISHAVSLPWGVITPAARAEWEHQYLNDNRSIAMRLSQAAAGLGNFIIQTGEPDRDYVNLGGSVTATLANGGSGFVRYETRLGQSYVSDHIVEAGLRLSF